jgi:hypothetical protein
VTLVNQAMTDYIQAMSKKHDQEWTERHEGQPPKLFISALGHCLRKAFFDCTKHIPGHPWQREETHPFSDYVRRGLHEGNVGEDDTAKALTYQYGDDLICQYQIEHPIWSGRPDFFIKPDIVVEHKVTAASNFVRKNGLPYDFHCLQVLAYRKFMMEQLDREIYARLYYRALPRNWAEFEIYDCGDYITCEGHINGKKRTSTFDISLAEEMESFEHYWLSETLPDRYEHPLSAKFGCARKNKGGVWPNCTFFGVCWPHLPEGPIDEDLLDNADSEATA